MIVIFCCLLFLRIEYRNLGEMDNRFWKKDLDFWYVGFLIYMSLKLLVFYLLLVGVECSRNKGGSIWFLVIFY